MNRTAAVFAATTLLHAGLPAQDPGHLPAPRPQSTGIAGKSEPAWPDKSEAGSAAGTCSAIDVAGPARRGADPILAKAAALTRPGLAAALDDPDLVLFDQPEPGGAIWARGSNFKVAFDDRGWTFYGKPMSGAPDLEPIRFDLAGVRVGAGALAVADATPRREGHRIAYDHGAVVQRVDVDGRGVEQSFVIDALPARGELVVDLAVATLLAAGATATGLEFTGPYDRATYSHAVAIDARGERIDCATEFADGHLTIRVPAGFVAAAALPLVVDPRVAYAVPATSTNGDLADPDVAAFTRTIIASPVVVQDAWTVVWSHYFGGSDWDCYALLVKSITIGLPTSPRSVSRFRA